MSKYWENASGCYDPTAAKIIEKENFVERVRDKEVHDTIREIKNILKYRNLELIDRVKLKDKETGRKYL
ncbi:hypothetical protein [Sporanaerobacter sp. PP17-6a]|uniref:hypothetical protein n=1 Tax=Sporanaerobacter sp. PP17-6a TaxID=1891289 RepID=UPI0008A040AC|nr:hypothetical protein [Sporanaerobacter sp. PP17-6a]SCL85029.1 hypothetical protein PP176A_0784 [Sporanaerobacter sp. PP17-6a]